MPGDKQMAVQVIIKFMYMDKKYGFLLLFFILALPILGKSQQLDSNSTSRLVENYSYFWRLDSLGSNGFRLQTYVSLLKSKIDTLTQETLIKEFGAPNKIWDHLSGKGKTYVYHVLNGSKMPKNSGYYSLGCTAVCFVFDSEDKYLIAIKQVDIDM
jgi:hypothetical protein